MYRSIRTALVAVVTVALATLALQAVSVPPATGVDPAPEPIEFVGAAHSEPGTATFKQLTVPAEASAGDTMILIFTAKTDVAFSGPTGVAGWSQVATFANNSLTSTIWKKQVAAGDPGAGVRMDYTPDATLSKGVLSLAVYSGVDASALVASATAAVGDSGVAEHTTPSAATQPADWALSYWASKSSPGSTTWTAPTGVTERDSAIDTGTSRYNMLFADSGGAVGTDTYGGLTATEDTMSAKGNSWTVVLSPKPVVPVKVASTLRAGVKKSWYGKRARVSVHVESSPVATGVVDVSKSHRRLGHARLNKHGKAVVWLGKRALRPGSHLLTVRYRGEDRVEPSADRVRLRVAKAVPRVRAKVRTHRVHVRHTHARVRVRVRATGGVPTTGRVTVRNHHRKVGGARLHHGKTTLRLKTFRHRGIRHLKVRYKGSSTVRAGTRTLRLRVRR